MSVVRNLVSLVTKALWATICSLEWLLPTKRSSIVILDDIFPHLLSAFRIAEYNYYMACFPDLRIYSTATAFATIGEMRPFKAVVGEYENNYGQFKGRVLKFNRFKKIKTNLIYLIFLNNAFRFVDYIDSLAIPFVFTLYPGGGFKLHQEDSDMKLRKVLSSPNFRKVIVTQKVSYHYLIDNQFCRPEQVELIYGGVLPSGKLLDRPVPKKLYKHDKATFDICFIANKYMERGVDKGYDVFIDVAVKLHELHPDISFHVVGPFDQSDVNVEKLDGSIRFHGTHKTDFFPLFYACMDLILSPNKPFVLAPGAFDGFPTGCCIEAGLSGVAVFCTDMLGLNTAFKDGEDIVLISENVSEIVDAVLRYYHAPERLYQLSANGKKTFGDVFEIEHQMQPRVKVLNQHLKASGR